MNPLTNENKHDSSSENYVPTIMLPLGILVLIVVSAISILTAYIFDINTFTATSIGSCISALLIIILAKLDIDLYIHQYLCAKFPHKY